MAHPYKFTMSNWDLSPFPKYSILVIIFGDEWDAANERKRQFYCFSYCHIVMNKLVRLVCYWLVFLVGYTTIDLSIKNVIQPNHQRSNSDSIVRYTLCDTAKRTHISNATEHIMVKGWNDCKNAATITRKQRRKTAPAYTQTNHAVEISIIISTISLLAYLTRAFLQTSYHYAFYVWLSSVSSFSYLDHVHTCYMLSNNANDQHRTTWNSKTQYF